MGQEQVQHRSLIHHDGLRVQRVLLVAAELHRLRVEGEQAVDGFGLLSGHLGEALRGSSGRRSQQDGLAHRAPQSHNRAGRERLAAPGTSCQHQQARGSRQFDRLALLVREGDVPLLSVAQDPALHAWEVDRNRRSRKGGETRCQGLLRVVERGRITHALVLEVPVTGLRDELPVLGHLVDELADAYRVYRGVWQGQPLDDALGQFPLRQEAVTLLGRLLQHIEHSRLIAEVGIGGDADVTRDGVGGHESDAEYIDGELVGILETTSMAWSPYCL